MPKKDPQEDQKKPTEPDYKGMYQRSLADLENNRKRYEQDKQQFAKYALTGATESILPVVDNFYRATDHIPAEQKDTPWTTGIMHIRKQLLDSLETWGVQEIPVKPGDPFDPSIHEAIGTLEETDIPEDHVATIQNRGYRLNGQVVRPAIVLISKNNQE